MLDSSLRVPVLGSGRARGVRDPAGGRRKWPGQRWQKGAEAHTLSPPLSPVYPAWGYLSPRFSSHPFLPLPQFAVPGLCLEKLGGVGGGQGEEGGPACSLHLRGQDTSPGLEGGTRA